MRQYGQYVIFFCAFLFLTIPQYLDFWDEDHIAAKRALGILLSVITLWSFEALPIYITALLIPLPVVFYNVLLEGRCHVNGVDMGVTCADDQFCAQLIINLMENLHLNQSGVVIINKDEEILMRNNNYDGHVNNKGHVDAFCVLEPLSAPVASKKVASFFFAPIAFQFLGIFAITGAMKKLGLDRKMASIVLKWTGSNPQTMLLGVMLVGWFLSMWITNVAATVVVLSLVSQVLQNFDNDSFPKAFLLGIAYSCNIAGMTTPIASPQNLLANSALENAGHEVITFSQWLIVGGITSLIGVIITYFFLLMVFRPTSGKMSAKNFDVTDVELGPKTNFVLLVSCATIGLWSLGSVPGIKKAFGDVALAGAIPVTLFLANHILNKNDFLYFSWDIIILVGGGLALGHTVSSSRLLTIMTTYLKEYVGTDPTKMIWVFGLFAWAFSNFISHTVAAAIIMPVIASTSVSSTYTSLASPIDSTAVAMETFRPQLGVLLAVMLDSGACALPVSGFPNTLAFAQKDSFGKPFLNTKDFLKTGIPVGLMMVCLVNSIGNLLCIMVGL